MKILLFDIDGTLIHSNGAGRMALQRALTRAFGHEWARDVDVHGRTDRGIISNIFALHSVADSEENWERFQQLYLEELPAAMHERNGVVLSGVLELLEALREREDFALGLLTGNSQNGARIKLEHFGLHDHFQFGGFGDLHPHRDDVARDALHAATEFLGEAPILHDVWVIGDTPHDVTCGHAIGARVAAVATGMSSREQLAAQRPHLLLDDLTQSESLWAAWKNGSALS